MKLETSRNVTKSKRSLHWCRSIGKKYLCTFYYSISQKVITLSGRRFITVSGVLLHYRAVITLSGVFYYIIGQLLQYRAFIILSVGTKAVANDYRHSTGVDFERNEHAADGVTADQARQNSSNVGVSLRATWDTTLVTTITRYLVQIPLAPRQIRSNRPPPHNVLLSPICNRFSIVCKNEECQLQISLEGLPLSGACRSIS